jgi:eukaryotic-like serine/threonine-protein kinase
VAERYPEDAQRRRQKINEARDLVACGDLNEAFRAYVAVEAYEEAAEVRDKQGRPGEAARLLLLGVGSALGNLGRLEGSARVRALRAVDWLVMAGEPRGALALLTGLGEKARARELAQTAGLPAEDGMPSDLLGLCREAARLAEELEHGPDGARLLEALGAYGEAALTYLATGHRRESLAALLRIPHGDPQYRPACVRAVALAAELQAMGVVLEQFLSHFVRTGPLSAVELDTFYRVAVIYEKQGLLGNAEEALRRLVAIRPDYTDAASALSRIEKARRAVPAGAASILAEEAAFHRRPRQRAAPREVREPTVAREPTARTDAPTATLPVSAGLPFAEGTLVADRYRLGPVIGRGGMSVVFEAHDIELSDVVALKVFVHAVESDELLARFRRELQISRQLVHANILRLHDLGSHARYRFVSMERLVGADLRHRCESKPTLDAAIGFVRQALAGLAAAHSLGVVHRDIKPENLFVTDVGVLKIMDFGIAKVMSVPNVTLGGVIWGTPRYMSPEQINSFSKVTASSDLYSLGVVAYELLVGHAPFDHPELTELLMMHLRQAPLAPRELRPEIPAALDALVVQMLAKDPTRRPASATECEERLRGLT